MPQCGARRISEHIGSIEDRPPRLARRAAGFFYPFTDIRIRDALAMAAPAKPIRSARPRTLPPILPRRTPQKKTPVSPRNSKALAARLTALGATVQLKLYPGKGHVDLAKALSKPFRGSVPVLADSAAFLHAHSP